MLTDSMNKAKTNFVLEAWKLFFDLKTCYEAALSLYYDVV